MSDARTRVPGTLHLHVRGQAMTEMLLVSLAVVAALLLPGPTGEPVALWLLRAVRALSREFVRWLAWV